MDTESLHDVSAVGLDCLHAQLEPLGDLARRVALREQAQHLHLAGAEPVERPAHGEGGVDCGAEPAEVGLEDEVLRPCFQRLHGRPLVERAGHDDQRYRRAGGAEQLERGHGVEPGERMIGEHDVRRELAQRIGEGIAGVGDSRDAWDSGALERELDQLGISRSVFEQ